MIFRIDRVVLVLLVGTSLARAQIDPEKRQLLQLGYNQPLEGRGPIAGYAYYYLNEPDFPRTNQTLRLAVAPVYLDGELGLRGALGPQTDLAIGVAGGGFADSYSEIRGGVFFRQESFTGHGGEASLSVYHRFNPAQEIPLSGIVRGVAHYTVYQRDDRTAPGFVLPEDRTTLTLRTGLRWGGREPVISPSLAMEMSVWYEALLRSNPGRYGNNGDREVNGSSHLFWGRAMLIYTLPEWKHNFSLSLTGGASVEADRFSSYRLGSALPLASEFPLNLPGYYFQEITARHFALLNGEYFLPLDAGKNWGLTFFAATAVVDYLPGLEQPGAWHAGAGGGLTYKSPRGTWQVFLGYAHGVDAIRTGGPGANSFGVLYQYDLEAGLRGGKPFFTPAGFLERLRGLERIFGR